MYFLIIFSLNQSNYGTNLFPKHTFDTTHIIIHIMCLCQRLLPRGVSFSVKHAFPLSVLSFPCLRVSAVSLLSKKGLRYLLYPFISLWMVGGRISPSFISALSIELSNNLRTKAEREREKEVEKNRNKNYFLLRITRWIPLHAIRGASIEFHGESCKPRWVEEKTGD